MKQLTQKKLGVMPIESMIRVVRNQKVMLDHDLAVLYGVETKVLNQAMQRNLERFPEDFMFQLSSAELKNWRSQIVTSNPAAKMSLRRRPYAFTEHGIAMLSSVLRSPRAIQMNILIIRAFVRLRELIVTNRELAARVEKLERSNISTVSIIDVLVEDIDKLSKDIHWIKNPPVKPKHRIGFFVDKESKE